MLAVSVSEMEMTMPKGTRHRATMLAEKLMEDDAENIVRAVVNAAKAGDPTAMRLCIERLTPVPQRAAGNVRSAANQDSR